MYQKQLRLNVRNSTQPVHGLHAVITHSTCLYNDLVKVSNLHLKHNLFEFKIIQNT